MSEANFERLWSTITTGEVWDEEVTNRRKSGERYVARQTIAPLVDEADEIEAYVAIQTDITEHKEREARLRQYEQAVEGAEELIAAIDDEYRYLFANRAYRDFHGLDPETVTGQTVAEAIGAERFRWIKPSIDRAFDGETVEYRMTRRRANRPDRTFNIRYYPLFGDGDAVRAVVGTMRDLTGQVERQRQLASLDRMLRHTIRNDLDVIQSRAELIAERAPADIAALTGPILDSVQDILAHAEKEREIVRFLSDPSPPQPLFIADVVEQIVEGLAPAFPAADIAVDVPETLRVTTIPEIERAIEEVLLNALEHNTGTAPTVTISAMEDEESIELRIEDNGPGIPAEEQHIISEEADIDQLAHSSGMGLWLVKRIVNRANGAIRFDETDRDGTTVTLVVPREPVPPAGQTLTEGARDE